MKRACILLVLVLLTAFCLPCCAASAYEKYSHFFFNTFDTLVTLTAFAQDESTFDEIAAVAEAEMTRYHRIFDKYNAYDGVYNLYYVNNNAANGPVKAEPELIALLLQVRSWNEQYGDALNPAMGSVLQLWHAAREDGTYLPAQQDLALAAQHIRFEDVIIDEAAGTICFADPAITLDLGAVGKGYAAECTANLLSEYGITSFILNAGGNVICRGVPQDGRNNWNIAIEDLDGSSTKLIISTTDTCVVTSGDYQRYFIVDDVRYHHIIDRNTLMPATHMRAVTILHPDSGLADFLSTTAFLLPYEQSRALIESIPQAEAMWTLNDLTLEMTPGFAELVIQ